jgi:hypothetical protein
MSSMEPEVRDFLKRVMQSVFAGLLWLIFNMTLGIYFGLLFVHDRLTIWNILYYLLLGTSMIFLLRFYYRTWKNSFPRGK